MDWAAMKVMARVRDLVDILGVSGEDLRDGR